MAVALQDGDQNLGSGTFGDPGDGIRIINLSGRDYVEHTTPNPNSIFEVDWTAPEAGSGEVRFYAAGNATNFNGVPTGDGAVFLENPLVINELVTSSREQAVNLTNFQIAPNPAAQDLRVEIILGQGAQYDLEIRNLLGQKLIMETRQYQAGRNQVLLDLTSLENGLYLITMTNGQEQVSKKFFKR